MQFSAVCKWLLIGSIVALGVVSASPSLAAMGSVSSDSVSLTAAGDTAEITFSSNVRQLMIDVRGGDIHFNLSSDDASDTDFPKFDDADPLVLNERWTSVINVISDSQNGSPVTVWIRGLR